MTDMLKLIGGLCCVILCASIGTLIGWPEGVVAAGIGLLLGAAVGSIIALMPVAFLASLLRGL